MNCFSKDNLTDGWNKFVFYTMLDHWLVSVKSKQEYTDNNAGIFTEGRRRSHSGTFNFCALQFLINGYRLQNVSKFPSMTKRSVDPWTTWTEGKLELRKEGTYFTKCFEMVFIWKTSLVFHSLRKYIKIYSNLKEI